MSFAMSLKDVGLHTKFVTAPWRYTGMHVAIVLPDCRRATGRAPGRPPAGHKGDKGTAAPSSTAISGVGIRVAVYNGPLTGLAARAAADGFTVTGIATASSQDTPPRSSSTDQAWERRPGPPQGIPRRRA
jgi:hypothetical protein